MNFHQIFKEKRKKKKEQGAQCVQLPTCREVVEMQELQSSAYKHYLTLCPKSTRQSPLQFPSLAGEALYVYKTIQQRYTEEIPP